jgi:hypothetical protein
MSPAKKNKKHIARENTKMKGHPPMPINPEFP